MDADNDRVVQQSHEGCRCQKTGTGLLFCFKKEAYISAKEPYVSVTALFIHKKALYLSKKALYLCKRAIHFIHTSAFVMHDI